MTSATRRSLSYVTTLSACLMTVSCFFENSVSPREKSSKESKVKPPTQEIKNINMTCQAGDPNGVLSSVQRLTKQELINVYKDLFTGVLSSEDLTEVANTFPEEGSDGIFSNKPSSKTYQHVFAMYNSSNKAATKLSSSITFKQRWGNCEDPSQECAVKTFTSFAPRAIRRPLKPDEEKRYVNLIAEGESPDVGLESALLSLLSSLSFTHKVELGEGNVTDKTTALSSYELASRLSFVLTSSLPDDDLWKSAQDGSILEPDVYASHVTRLTQSETFKNRVLSFFAQLAGVPKDTSHTYSPHFLKGIDPEVLIAEAKDEFKNYVSTAVFEKEMSLNELYTSQMAVPMGRQLQAIYRADDTPGKAIETVNSEATTQDSHPIESFNFTLNQPENSNTGEKIWTPHGPDSKATKVINISTPGAVTLSFVGRGELLNNVAPRAIFKLFQQGAATPVETLSVSADWTTEMTHTFPPVTLAAGSYTVELSTDNDEFIPGTGDRNIWFKSVSVAQGMRTSPATAAVVDKSLSQHRPGLFGRIAFLMSKDDETHLVHRGLKMRRNFLCEVILAPNINSEGENNAVDLSAPAPSVDESIMEQIKTRTSGATCAGCHNNINPPGFVMEYYDGLGRYTTREVVYDENGNQVAEHPVIVSIKPSIESPDEAEVTNLPEFVQVLATSQKAKQCLAKRWVEFSLQRPVEKADNCLLSGLYSALEQSEAKFNLDSVSPGSVRAMLVSLVTSEDFKLLQK